MLTGGQRWRSQDWRLLGLRSVHSRTEVLHQEHQGLVADTHTRPCRQGRSLVCLQARTHRQALRLDQSQEEDSCMMGLSLSRPPLQTAHLRVQRLQVWGSMSLQQVAGKMQPRQQQRGRSVDPRGRKQCSRTLWSGTASSSSLCNMNRFIAGNPKHMNELNVRQLRANHE
jgi:hypothetical protein